MVSAVRRTSSHPTAPTTVEGTTSIVGGRAIAKTGTPPRERVGIRDAATLVIVDRTAGAPRILMGRRRADQVFLPNKYVFPGGRVERGDHGLGCARPLCDEEALKLSLALTGRRAATFPQALALAAIRETFEETGIVIGRGLAVPFRGPAAWRSFFATGYTPDLGDIAFFARAITPPGRPRRYDTRFFIVPSSAIATQLTVTDGELSSLAWLTLDEIAGLDLPNITRLILRDLEALLAAPTLLNGRGPVPFYVHRNGTYAREVLELPSRP